MWPKLFYQLVPQLIDLLPHVQHVVPVAEKLLASRAESDAAIATMRESVNANFGRVGQSNAELSAKLDELSASVAVAGEAAEQARVVSTALGHTVVTIERAVRSVRALLVAILVLLIMLLLLVGWLALTRSH